MIRQRIAFKVSCRKCDFKMDPEWPDSAQEMAKDHILEDGHYDHEVEIAEVTLVEWDV